MYEPRKPRSHRGGQGFKSPQLHPKPQVKDLLIFPAHRPEDYLLAARWRDGASPGGTNRNPACLNDMADSILLSDYCHRSKPIHACFIQCWPRGSSDTARKFAVFTPPAAVHGAVWSTGDRPDRPMLRTERSTARARPSQVERGAQGDAHRLYDIHLAPTIRSLMAELMLSSCITPTNGG